MSLPDTNKAPCAFDASGVRAALVDLDGTIADTAGDFTAALNGMLSGLEAASIEVAETIGYVGKGTEHLIRCVLAARYAAPRAAELYERALADYQKEYARINGHYAKLYPGVAEGLAALDTSGIVLACVTNKPHRFAVELLERLELAQRFAFVLGGDSLPRKKPDPLPMLEACRRLGVAPHEAVAIGDSENDALAARAAGLRSMTVPYGYNHGKDVQSLDTDAIVGTLREAAALILQHSS